MMARTQILIDRHLLRRARERAAQAGISLAEYIRQLVARDLAGTRAVREPSAVFNLGASGGSDIAKEKDALIADAVTRGRAGRGKRR